MELQNMLRIKNNQSIDIQRITLLDYNNFYSIVLEIFEQDSNHCLTYFAYENNNGLHFIMAIADDKNQNIILLSHFLKSSEKKS
jgi:hypothetical protein